MGIGDYAEAGDRGRGPIQDHPGADRSERSGKGLGRAPGPLRLPAQDLLRLYGGSLREGYVRRVVKPGGRGHGRREHLRLQGSVHL